MDVIKAVQGDFEKVKKREHVAFCETRVANIAPEFSTNCLVS